MKHFLQFCAFLVYAIFLLTNCKPKSVDPSPNIGGTTTSSGTNTTKTTGLINTDIYQNLRWGYSTYKSVTNYDSCGAYLVNSKLLIYASTVNGTLFLQVTNPTLGQNLNVSCWTINKYGGSTIESGSGTLNLTTYDSNKNLISGSYSIKTYFDNSLYSTHTGIFFEIPFSSYPNYIPNLKNEIGVGIVSMYGKSSDYFYGSFFLDSLKCFASNDSGLINI
ncbi:MAG: hypothetical protein K2Q22_11965, partial [Cytophagales bacterium]|nr:hypothetical protein [Cytophagales bacterium]